MCGLCRKQGAKDVSLVYWQVQDEGSVVPSPPPNNEEAPSLPVEQGGNSRQWIPLQQRSAGGIERGDEMDSLEMHDESPEVVRESFSEQSGDFKKVFRNFPGGPEIKNSLDSPPNAEKWVCSLVRELGSHMPKT